MSRERSDDRDQFAEMRKKEKKKATSVGSVQKLQDEPRAYLMPSVERLPLNGSVASPATFHLLSVTRPVKCCTHIILANIHNVRTHAGLARSLAAAGKAR